LILRGTPSLNMILQMPTAGSQTNLSRVGLVLLHGSAAVA